jgi:hypothetical protein
MTDLFDEWFQKEVLPLKLSKQDISESYAGFSLCWQAAYAAGRDSHRLVLPERKAFTYLDTLEHIAYCDGWNAYLDAIKIEPINKAKGQGE